MSSSNHSPTDPDNWDAHAASYADRATALTLPFARDLVAALAPVLQAPSTRVVLDVACGGGSFALAYLQRFPRGIAGQTVLSTDRSEAMVAAARRAVADALPTQLSADPQQQQQQQQHPSAASHCATRFAFAVEDATALAGVPDGSVQAIVSAFGVFLVPDGAKVFQAVRRVMDPSVRSVFATTAWTDLPPEISSTTDFGILMMKASMAAIKIADPEVAKEFNKEKDDAAAEKEPWKLWGDAEAAKRLVLDGGLHRPLVSRTVHSLCVGDKRDLWTTMSNANPMVDVSSRSAEDIAQMEQCFHADLGLHDSDASVFLIAAANVVMASNEK